MDKIQEIDLSSFLGIEKTTLDFAAELADFAEIVAVGALITNRKGEITAMTTVQMNGAKDKTGFKTSIRTELEEKFSTVVKVIEGSIGDNPGLTAKYKSIMPSDLLRAKDMEVGSMVAMVVTDARSLGTKVNRFGISAALMTEMETLATNYTVADADKRTVSGLATSATADLAKIFDEINKALRAADLVVKPLEGLKPAFFKAWFEARKKQGI